MTVSMANWVSYFVVRNYILINWLSGVVSLLSMVLPDSRNHHPDLRQRKVQNKSVLNNLKKRSHAYAVSWR